MICRKCTAAAEIQKSAAHYGNTTVALTDHGSHFNAPTGDVMFKVGRLLHTECRGGTHCDCQHKDVGTTINYKAVNAANKDIRESLSDAQRSDEQDASQAIGEVAGSNGQEERSDS